MLRKGFFPARVLPENWHQSDEIPQTLATIWQEPVSIMRIPVLLIPISVAAGATGKRMFARATAIPAVFGMMSAKETGEIFVKSSAKNSAKNSVKRFAIVSADASTDAVTIDSEDATTIDRLQEPGTLASSSATTAAAGKFRIA
jgi:hypothetical protein